MARTKKSMTDFKKSEIAKNKESELTKTKKSEMAKTKKSVRKTKDQENPQALIGQRLKKYRTHEEIVNLAHRLFQKCPSVSLKTMFFYFSHRFILLYNNFLQIIKKRGLCNSPLIERFLSYWNNC